jgi:hypothetical protein
VGRNNRRRSTFCCRPNGWRKAQGLCELRKCVRTEFRARQYPERNPERQVSRSPHDLQPSASFAFGHVLGAQLVLSSGPTVAIYSAGDGGCPHLAVFDPALRGVTARPEGDFYTGCGEAVDILFRIVAVSALGSSLTKPD